MGTTASRLRTKVWWACAAALAIGLPILFWGIRAPSAPELHWFVPVADGIAIVCMVAVCLLGSLDAHLRQNRRSLPVVFIAAATAVMWAGHFVLFPGDVPALRGEEFNEATSTLFLTISLATPLMLSVALPQRAGPLTQPKRSVAAAISTGATVGVLAIAFAVIVGPSLETVSPSGTFSPIDRVVGVAGLIPALIGLSAYFLGLHGDERIAGGVLAALTFSALSSVSLFYLHARFTPSWYASHTLTLLPFIALLAGQLWLYAHSVKAERIATAAVAAAAERRRIGLDIAQAMARETDPMPVVDRLLSGVLEALEADRVTMLRLVPEGFVIERSIDREGRPAYGGQVLPLNAVVSGARAIVRRAVEQMQPVVSGPFRVIGLEADAEDRHQGIAQSIVMPLVRGGTVDGVLIAGRRDERPFTSSDVDQLEELGAIAALLIRNVRLLAEAESISRAKSNFINLAAHELGTPISVIRGYTEMLDDETLGSLTPRQRGPMDALRHTTGELAKIVDQLLIASRLEAEAAMPAPIANPAADVCVVARDALRRAEDRARLIAAEVNANIPDEPVMVVGAERDIGIVLDNLLNNGMTFNRPPVRVTVEVASEEQAEVRVIDNGIGVPEWARERIFEQFYRVDDVEFGYPSGTGLGLYISRRLAERYGGQLFLERSSPNEGSVFTLRLQRPNA